MKKFKKIFAAIAASALVAAMSFTSMAASIQINNVTSTGTNNTTYQYYRVLKASVSSDKSAVAYYVNNSDLATAIGNLKDSDGSSIFTVTSSVDQTRFNVSLNEGKTFSGKVIADAFKTIVDNENLRALIDVKGSIKKNNEGNYQTGDLADGYYLIVSSLGTTLALDTASGEGDVCYIKEKNEYPTVDKTVEQTVYNVGDSVKYTITVYVPASVDTDKTITVHDTMAGVLLLDQNSVAAKDHNNNAFTGYSVVINDASDKNHKDTFDFQFKPTDAMKGHNIVFTYDAELLHTAEANTPYSNTVYLTYADYTTPTQSVDIKTYDFDLKKTKETLDGERLDGAKFQLRTIADQSDTALKFTSDGTGYVKADSQTLAGSSATIEAGEVNVRGIGNGTYYLVETEAPEGYNALSEAVKIEISTNESGIKVLKVNSNASDIVTVANKKGIKLPSTGGMGTTVFAIVGLLVMAGAAVTLIVKKRA